MPTLSLYLAVVVTWQRGPGLINAAAWSSAVAISFGEMRIDALIWAWYNTFLEKGKKVNKTHKYYFFVTVATDFWQSSEGFILWVPRLCSSRVIKNKSPVSNSLWLHPDPQHPVPKSCNITNARHFLQVPPCSCCYLMPTYSPLHREQLDDQRAAIAW